MLEDVAGIRRVVIACAYVDLRKGIDGLSIIIGDRYHQNPFEKGTLFLFCGGRSDRIKELLWMGDGFLQLYKRLEAGSLSWPRTSEEVNAPYAHIFFSGYKKNLHIAKDKDFIDTILCTVICTQFKLL